MKTRVWNYLLPLLFLMSGTAAIAQNQNDASVPGDNFSLEGALDLFKKSASPEEFEKMLNSSDSKVNNLDLNGDGKTDYIRVVDKNEGNVHAFILQSVISENESQDVAVIELEKLGDGKARLQIIGDEDVYGQETIIEPTQDVRINAGSSTARTIVNVWAWPSVQYVYGPYYHPWVSPWGWAYYPGWWSPWNPVAYAVYNPWWVPYRAYYSPCYSYRIGYAHRMYRPYRTTSVIVYNRHSTQINHYRSQNNYYSNNGRSHYSRGTYDGNNGRHSGNDGGRQTYYDKNHGNGNSRSSWSGADRNSNHNRSSWPGGNTSRSSWRSNNDNSRSGFNQGGRSVGGSSDGTTHFSDQQRSSWGSRFNSGGGNSNTRSNSANNNWQQRSFNHSGSNGRGSGNSGAQFSRPQGSSGGSFHRSAPSGGVGGGGGSHSAGGSRGRH